MKKQHTTPCAQCPFRRVAPEGWLGGMTPEDFHRLSDSTLRMPCHSALPDGVNYFEPGTKENNAPQCAGRAIYQANSIKRPDHPNPLILPPDRETVFAWPAQFIEHHSSKVGKSPHRPPEKVTCKSE